MLFRLIANAPTGSLKERLALIGGKGVGLQKLIGRYNVPVTWVAQPHTTPNRGDIAADLNVMGYAIKPTALLAVRSSAPVEDTGELSFAGQFKTLLNVPAEAAALTAAIEQVRRTTDSARLYAEAFDVMLPDTLPVLVQPMVEGIAMAGTYLSVDIHSGNMYKGCLDWVERQDGSGLVSGEVAPAGSLSASLQEMSLPGNPRWFSMLMSALISLTKEFNHPIDVEWAYSDSDDLLWILQVRPISHRILANFAGKPGLGITKLVGTGPVHRQPSEEPFRPGSVLVTQMTKPDMIQAIRASVAVVTSVGGRTCHAAIVCREFNKPCVVGQPLANILANGEVVTVDGRNGSVTRC